MVRPRRASEVTNPDWPEIDHEGDAIFWMSLAVAAAVIVVAMVLFLTL